MAKALLEQTGACCRLLETLGATPLVESVAAQQAQSLMSLAKPLKLLPSEVADLASAVSKSCFPEFHKNSLLTCFTSRLASHSDVSTGGPKSEIPGLHGRPLVSDEARLEEHGRRRRRLHEPPDVLGLAAAIGA